MHITDLVEKDSGKKLPKAWQKTLLKLVDAGKLTAEMPEDNLVNKTTRVNPFTGVKVTLSQTAAQLADWIVSMNPIGNGTNLTRSDWDNARYTFNVVWPDQYYDLID